MLSNRKRIYALCGYTVECRARGWFYRRTDSSEDWKGPYSTETSVTLMLARALKRELVKRDALPT
jgi:hypothetical protein